MKILPILCLVSIPLAAHAAGVDKATCDANYAAMIDAAEANRNKSLKELDYQLRRAADDDQATRLIEEMEGTWNLEAEFRSNAAIAYRDCLRAAGALKSGGS